MKRKLDIDDDDLGDLLEEIVQLVLKVAEKSRARRDKGDSATSTTGAAGEEVYRCVVTRGAERGSHSQLSPRELQIAMHVADGRGSKWIGRSLKISRWTVETHIRRIYQKLHCDSRAGMVACLLRESGPNSAAAPTASPAPASGLPSRRDASKSRVRSSRPSQPAATG